MIETRYHDSVNALYDLCHPGAADHAQSPFDRPEWFELLAETGLAPLVVTATEGKTSAALPLTQDTGRITALRNWYSFTWRDLAPASERSDRLLIAIACALKSRGYRVTLEPVPEEDGSSERLAQAFIKAGWSVRSEQCDINHVLHVKGRSFADYWATRPGRMRTTLKRKAQKVSVRLLTHFDEAAWADYERIYAESWKPEEDHPEMLRKFAREEGEAGRLRMALADFEGAAIAAQCWSVERGTAYIHKLAHLESHKHLSAGTTLSAALFEHVIDQDKVDLIDFGTGDQPYQADWMEDLRPRYRIDCLNPRQPRAWPALAKRAYHDLRERLA